MPFCKPLVCNRLLDTGERLFPLTLHPPLNPLYAPLHFNDKRQARTMPLLEPTK